MTSNLFGIGLSGLLSHQSALGTTGNNITNANTPGYSRQRVNFETSSEQFGGVGYIGTGTKINSIERVVEQFVVNQLRVETAGFHQANAMASQLEQLDALLADESTGIAPMLQQFYAALEQASQDPTSMPVRQIVLSYAETLAQRFDALYARLQSQEQVINRQLDSLAAQATGLAEGIATLNQRIAEQSGTGSTPNALLDKRDELLRGLSELISVKVVEDANGMVNVYVGNGQPLVVGNQANALATAPSINNPARNEILFVSNTTSQEVSQFLTGGSIGGLLKFRSGSLDPAFNSLGRIALAVSDTINSQQQLGLDLDGNFGKNLFTDINNSALMQARAVPSDANDAGTDLQLQVFISNTGALTTSDYRLNITGPGPGDFTLIRSSDNQVVTTTGDLSGTITTPEGFEIRISGSNFAAGDRFLIQPTRSAAGDMSVALKDPSELAFAQPIRTGSSLDNSGNGAISSGEILATRDANGDLQTTFDPPGSLSPPLLVRFISGTDYELLDNSDPNAPAPLAPPVTGTIIPGQPNAVTVLDPVSGDAVYRFNLSGNPAAGDEFSIEFNANGSSDNRNALAMGGTRLDKTIGGRLDFESAYGQLVEQVGTRTAELKISRDAADTLVARAQANREAVSGVNLDEEAANLIRFEQAYNASAQVISVARQLFETLLSAVRR